MSNKLKILSMALIIMGLFSGCNESTQSCGCSTEHPNQNHMAVLSANKFNAETGTITEAAELNIPVANTTMSFSSGTVLQDANGDAITKVPTLEAHINKNETKATTTLSLTSNGVDVIPTEPVTVTIAAPTGASEGDTVNVTLPNGTTQTATVSADGTITLTLEPNNFTNGTMDIVVTLLDQSTN